MIFYEFNIEFPIYNHDSFDKQTAVQTGKIQKKKQKIQKSS